MSNSFHPGFFFTYKVLWCHKWSCQLFQMMFLVIRKQLAFPHSMFCSVVQTKWGRINLIWYHSLISGNVSKIIQILNKRPHLTCVVMTVPADALAPLGARASAGTVMTNLKSSICKIEIKILTYMLKYDICCYEIMLNKIFSSCIYTRLVCFKAYYWNQCMPPRHSGCSGTNLGVVLPYPGSWQMRR